MKHIMLVVLMVMSVACATTTTHNGRVHDSRFNDVEQTYSWR